MKSYHTCIICGAKLVPSETATWRYHVSWGGVKCSHHPGVKEEWTELFVKAQKKLQEIQERHNS